MLFKVNDHTFNLHICELLFIITQCIYDTDNRYYNTKLYIKYNMLLNHNNIITGAFI